MKFSIFSRLKRDSKKSGFTLVEVLVGIALLSIVFLGIYGAFQLGLKVTGQSKARVTAIAIANQKIEQIRNLPYDDIGTIGGVPPGVIPEIETEIRNGVNFTIKTTVLYIDDPFDDTSPDDPLPTDYKRAKVKVSWQGFFGGEVILITDIAPKGIETEEGGGTLKISVFNASGQGVSQADIHIVNNQVSPSIDASYQTDDSGNFILVGAPTSTEAYQITVSKSGFSQDRTYGREEIANPLKPHASVFEGQVTEISFSIDELSSFSIETRGRESFDDEFGNLSKISESSNVSISNGEVKLQEVSSYSPSGYLLSVEISPSNLINWDRLFWEDSEPEFTDIRYQLLYSTGTSFELIPEEDLPGNSEGFDTSPVDISGLDITKYKNLKIKGILSTSVTSTTPILYNWHLTYNTPLIPNVDFHLQGAKIIGTDENDSSVYKYSKDHTSDSQGLLNISNLEWDSYTFSATGTSLMDLVETLPSPQPIDLLPATTTQVTLYFKAENTLLVKVQDASTSDPIFGANVRVFNNDLGYDNSKPTDEKGQAFFIPLETASYNLEVRIEGYQAATTTVEVLGDTTKAIFLQKL
jgi:prepilin-type N-terminal cleavage/methylation domain-containing protein